MPLALCDLERWLRCWANSAPACRMFAKLHSCLATPSEVTADRRACCHGPLGWETGTAPAREVVAQRAWWVTLIDSHWNEVGGQSPRERRGGKAAAGTWSGSVRISGEPARRSHPHPARFSQGMTPSKVPAPTFSADPAGVWENEAWARCARSADLRGWKVEGRGLPSVESWTENLFLFYFIFF